ncbi:winged helix family two component transcriptional regulator [Candidatus Omnitrophus magneticus]|uniref:Winged helix family two component transcriptional regulator n=1 Tax=Candidatus Omnitrophus magneticus TaxID=1609969 RepID=A0A0F0CTV1_9BACT|nr:winged helix family two component transcriptional regulator [Candidatus Omnitrophus magneticus]
MIFVAGSKIFLVEDDEHIARLIKYNIEKNGDSCFTYETGEKLLEILSDNTPDIVVLDVMLPGKDGFEIIKEIKKIKSSLPVIMLTARGEEIDRIVGLELGADDYMVKPFSPRELMLRIKTILKRTKTPDSLSLNVEKNSFQFKDLIIDIPRHKVTTGNKEIVLTHMEFKLLLTLMQRAGRVQSRDRLLNDVWDLGRDVTTRTIDTHVKRLREKLGTSGRFIETIRGLGYRFAEAGK